MSVYCCTRKLQTFWCEYFCDTRFCWQFLPPLKISLSWDRPHKLASQLNQPESTVHLEALACFVHRVDRSDDSNIRLSMCCLEANTSIKLMTRPSPYIAVFHQYSVNRKTSLSLRPVGRKLLAPACALACTGLITCKFTVHSDHHSVPLRMPFGYYYRPLPLYTGFLPAQGKAYYWHPSVVPIAKSASLRVILTQWASIATPGRTVLFDANNSATHVFVGGFRLLDVHHWTHTDSLTKYP